ncbi:MAG: hypothetical protein AAGA83_11695 [Cyanobacteria bacterium P01_F01_bin.116]
MDTSMVLGLTLAGFIVLINGNKKPDAKGSGKKSNDTEVVVRLVNGNPVVSPNK